MVGVQHLKTAGELTNIATRKGLLTLHAHGDFIGNGIASLLEADHFQVQDDFGHVLNHPFNSRKLVQYTVRANGRDSKAFQRRQQNATQGIADGDAVALLERLKFKRPGEVVGFLHHHFLRHLKS